MLDRQLFVEASKEYIVNAMNRASAYAVNTDFCRVSWADGSNASVDDMRVFTCCP